MREQLRRRTCFKWNSHFVIKHFWFLLTRTVKVSQLFLICISLFTHSLFNGFSSGSCRFFWRSPKVLSSLDLNDFNCIEFNKTWKMDCNLGTACAQRGCCSPFTQEQWIWKQRWDSLPLRFPSEFLILKKAGLTKHEFPASLDSFRSTWEFSILP